MKTIIFSALLTVIVVFAVVFTIGPEYLHGNQQMNSHLKNVLSNNQNLATRN